MPSGVQSGDVTVHARDDLEPHRSRGTDVRRSQQPRIDVVVARDRRARRPRDERLHGAHRPRRPAAGRAGVLPRLVRGSRPPRSSRARRWQASCARRRSTRATAPNLLVGGHGWTGLGHQRTRSVACASTRRWPRHTPDLFINSGDLIYADNPLVEAVPLDDGTIVAEPDDTSQAESGRNAGRVPRATTPTT